MLVVSFVSVTFLSVCSPFFASIKIHGNGIAMFLSLGGGGIYDNGQYLSIIKNEIKKIKTPTLQE